MRAQITGTIVTCWLVAAGRSTSSQVSPTSLSHSAPVHVKFGLDAGEIGIFPTDFFTVPEEVL